MEAVYDLHQSSSANQPGAGGELKRRWGPLFLALMNAFRRIVPSAGALRISLRVFLTCVYVLTIVLLTRLLTDFEWPWPRSDAAHRCVALVFLSLQSSAAIYAISAGMGEVVTACTVVGHFYFFLRRQYPVAALLIAFGMYFKLYPIVFAFSFFLFALLSREHRAYCLHLVAAGLVMALVSVPIAGWAFGFFYPFVMIRSVMTDADLVPIVSREVFGLVSFISRASSSFRIHELDAPTLQLARTLAWIFGWLLIASTAAAAVVLWRLERVWSGDERMRNLALVIFQSAIGFLWFSFSLDVSTALVLPIAISLYSPLWVYKDSLRDVRRAGGLQTAALVTFGAGTILAGNVIPLSILIRALPLARLDRLAGNAPAALVPHEKYLWYEIPMIGVSLVAVSFVLSVLAYSFRSATIGSTRIARRAGR
jgi:hypothetical protein